MYLIAAVVMVLFGVLLCLSARREPPAGVGGVMRPFCKMASFLYQRIASHYLRSGLARRVAISLSRLNPGATCAELQEEYYVRKISLSLLVIALGTVFGVLASINAGNSVLIEQNGLVRRGEYPTKPREIQVAAEVDGLQVRLPVLIQPREYTETEAWKMLEQLEAALPDFMLGANEDLQNVRKDLMLLEEYEGYPAMVEWKTNRPDIISSLGEVREVEGDTQVELSAKLLYGECLREWRVLVMVRPPKRTAEEQLYRDLESVLASSDVESATRTEWQLPASLNGTRIHWEQIIADKGSLIWLGATGVAVLLYFCSDRDLEDKLRKRRLKMRHEYSELVHKLVLFAEAGMTLRGSFQKLAGDYEEIAFCCNELNSGISEGAVYERMGKRIALQEYIRLGTLLSQNLRLGNAALLERLREEADKAAEEKLHHARKAGEEAGTKLLVPMVLQLAVVMVMIMVPVFMNYC